MSMPLSGQPELTVDHLKAEAVRFAAAEGLHSEPTLYGVTDGKKVGTYLEQKFRGFLIEKYSFAEGNSASGIDFPSLDVDVKTTSIAQPQSSSPFKSSRQKVYGLGYSLLVFVYQKTDDAATATGRLEIRHTVFVEASRTADYQLTRAIRQVLDNDGNEDDLVALFEDKNLPGDEIVYRSLAAEVLSRRPEQGFLTISNALQWRLQYGRVITNAGVVDGILKLG